MKPSYPIIWNCNFSTRDDERGKTVHTAVEAVEAGLDDAGVIAALDTLEETLAEHAEDQHVPGVEACRAAERAVVEAYDAAALKHFAD